MHDSLDQARRIHLVATNQYAVHQISPTVGSFAYLEKIFGGIHHTPREVSKHGEMWKAAFNWTKIRRLAHRQQENLFARTVPMPTVSGDCDDMLLTNWFRSNTRGTRELSNHKGRGVINTIPG